MKLAVNFVGSAILRWYRGISWEHPLELFFKLEVEMQGIGLGRYLVVALNIHNLQSRNVEAFYRPESG